MFVILSKVLDLAVAPLTWALALGAVGLVLRNRRWSVALTALALVVLYAFSVAPVAARIAAWAEGSAVRTDRPEVTYDAVVVLSGEVDSSASRASGRRELTAAADRLVAGFDALRSGHAREILLTGVSALPAPGEQAEPELVAAELQAWGVAPERIVLETNSRNTHENAVATARIAAERGWRRLLLVTSAAHMPRALGCFRKAGLSPDSLPVDFRAGAEARGWLPRAASLAQSTEALREMTGRVVYRLVGYT